MIFLNYYRGSRTIGRFAKATSPLSHSRFLVPLHAPPTLLTPSTAPHQTNMFRLQAQLQSCIAVGRRQAGSRELAEGNEADHISSARAKYYSDVAFLTDTNCSSNKHRRANPRTFIRVEKDERKGQSQKVFESWPGVNGLRGSGETSCALLGFSP